MPPRLAFVELTVADWPTSVSWYGGPLGLPCQLRDDVGQFALFAAGECSVALKAGVPVPGGALLALRVDDLDAELARLAGLGVVPAGPVKTSAEGYRRAIFSDPDGYRVSLFEFRAM